MTGFKIVVWNSGAEVMNVMETDVAREPLQDFRQLIK
jgi:hypothetical protein